MHVGSFAVGVVAGLVGLYVFHRFVKPMPSNAG